MAEYVDKRCPFCGRADCFDLAQVGDHGKARFYQARTKCGWSSRLYTDRDDARIAWNTRGGREPEQLISQVGKVREFQRKAKVKDLPTGKVGDRLVGGSDENQRIRQELEKEADLANRNREGLKEAGERARRDNEGLDLGDADYEF